MKSIECVENQIDGSLIKNQENNSLELKKNKIYKITIYKNKLEKINNDVNYIVIK